MDGLVKHSLRKLTRLAHAEAVAVDGDGQLWATTDTGSIVKIDVERSAAETVADAGTQLLGLCFDAVGRVYCCDYDGGQILRFDQRTAELTAYSSGPLRNPNWCVFAEDGTLFVSDSGSERLEDCDGQIVSIPPGGGPGDVLPIRPLHYANGLALGPDGALFVIESFSGTISRYSDGELQTYATIDRTVPDGLAFDDQGGLLVSCFQPNTIFRIPPDGGEPVVVLDDWTGQQLLTPTNVAFFGPGYREIAIASLCGWSVSAATLPWPGQRLNYPTVPDARPKENQP